MAEQGKHRHAGHRQRMKTEFLTRGLEGWPDHRVLELLTAEAEMRQIDAVTLEATAAGRPLYEAFGFTAMRDEMELLGGNKFRDTGKEKIIWGKWPY